MGTGCFQGV